MSQGQNNLTSSSQKTFATNTCSSYASEQVFVQEGAPMAAVEILEIRQLSEILRADPRCGSFPTRRPPADSPRSLPPPASSSSERGCCRRRRRVAAAWCFSAPCHPRSARPRAWGHDGSWSLDGSGGSSTLASGMVYVVQPGDTVISIAREMNPTNPSLARSLLVHELGSTVVVPGEHVLIP